MLNIAKYETKELLVRKKIASFIEKIIRYFGNDIRHDVFKAVIYSESEAITKNEEAIKNYYDAYTYLLNNSKMVLSPDLLKRFFYILKAEVANEDFLTRVSSTAFHSLDMLLIKKLAYFPVYIYEELKSYEECERTMTALMFFNYYLVKNGIPTIHFLKKDLSEYIELRNNKDIEGLEKFVIKIIDNAKFQEKEYYKNLRDIDAVGVVIFIPLG